MAGLVSLQVLSELAPYFVTFLAGYLPVATLTDKFSVLAYTQYCAKN